MSWVDNWDAVEGQSYLGLRKTELLGVGNNKNTNYNNELYLHGHKRDLQLALQKYIK